ncbi:hypothetical protein ACWGKK_07970 [Streptomyces chartreusis]|nr:hypothetical protein [Streptomyces sp. KS_5]
MPRLPTGVRGFRFHDGCGHQVSVLWAAARRTRVSLPEVAYDIMGRRIDRSGQAVVASPDPVYVVSREAASIARDRGVAGALRRADPGSLSPTEHIVLSQRYAARNAAPGKDDGDAPPPHGYRLGRRTRMSLDVYNFGGRGRYVTVAAESMGAGWSVRPVSVADTRVWVPAGGRVGMESSVEAGRSVRRRVDRRLVFGARLDGGGEVPGNVALVHLK